MEEKFRLWCELQEYTKKDFVPLHMPGHKRRVSPAPGLPVGWDITELPGTDDLHNAQGILASAMARTAALYGAKRTWYLVNGSTCGLLAGIRALAPSGSAVIVARNCHKSVFHAIELGSLKTHWLLPTPVDSFGIWGSVTPASVEAALTGCPAARCVILTSPTYEGVVSDIAAISAICHAHGIPLLVDEAHGAHLGLPFSGTFPSGALQCGADLVIQSAHKTLPSLTQTAWLHLGGVLAEKDGIEKEIERQLDIFETSSPSYPLLASLDGCTGILCAEGADLFNAWQGRLDRFYQRASLLSRLRVLGAGGHSGGVPPEVFAFDRGKLLISGRGSRFPGPALAESLRGRFGIETEMSCGENLLAMTSPCDADDALDRLSDALAVLDGEAGCSAAKTPLFLTRPGPVHCTIAAALTASSRPLLLRDTAGRTATEYIWAYPPGVPIVVPGEEITEALIHNLEALAAAGTALHYSRAGNGVIQCLSD